jgi:putative ABC transport system ATP-binding protein
MIFADEPTGALNQKTSGEVMHILTMLNKEGTTIMLVTHDMKVAARCDKILYIQDGNIEGQCSLGKYSTETKREREKKVNNWLSEMGW